MKFRRAIFVLFALLISISTFAADPNAADESAVKQTIVSYFNGIDTRNSESVEKSLYTEATVVTINNISNKTNKLSADGVVDQIKKGTLGGWKREVSFDNLDVNDKTAMVKVELSDAKNVQTSYVSLINEKGEWKIVSEIAVISRNN